MAKQSTLTYDESRTGDGETRYELPIPGWKDGTAGTAISGS
jgi:hypothetical protein